MKVELKKVYELLYAIPCLSELTMCPSIFSDDIEKHDCDTCKSSNVNSGDLYDEEVCLDCWKRAVKSSIGI